MAADDRGSTPVPDPTVLTTEQLHREVATVRELVLSEIAHVKELTAVKFSEIEKRTVEQKTDTNAANQVALQAAKELVALQTQASDRAISKSEAATKEQIGALQAAVEQRFVAQGDRLSKVEAQQQIVLGQSMGRGAITGPIWGVVGAVVAALLTAAVLYFARR